MRSRRYIPTVCLSGLPGPAAAPGDPGATPFPSDTDWLEAETMSMASAPALLAGRKVVPMAESMDGAVPFDAEIALLTSGYPGVGGFLFVGDDGESLWFQPVGDHLAFQFDPADSKRLWSRLPASVSRLVVQGAMVLCSEERAQGNGDSMFHFPEIGLRAA
jgi:hypothetical protein